MGKLIYSAIMSADGYVEDADGEFASWAAPDEDVLGLVNDLERAAGTYLYGRRMYETMLPWETMPTVPGRSPGDRAFAEIWQAADKVVYSRTLNAVSTARTRLERDFDPAAVRDLVKAAEGDVTVGGATLAGHAVRAGLVEELQLFLQPVLVGGGKRALPNGVRQNLDLLETRRFAGGTVFLRYAVR